jgi:hypothetical protein
MDPVTIIAVITGLIKVYEELAGDAEKRQMWQRRLKALEAAGKDAVADLQELMEGIAEEVALTSARKRRAEIARQNNPAFRKGGTLALLVIAGLTLTGCSSIRRLNETPEYRAGYAVEWPADASKDPAHYKTEMVDGVMITTVPVR